MNIWSVLLLVFLTFLCPTVFCSGNWFCLPLSLKGNLGITHTYILTFYLYCSLLGGIMIWCFLLIVPDNAIYYVVVHDIFCLYNWSSINYWVENFIYFPFLCFEDILRSLVFLMSIFCVGWNYGKKFYLLFTFILMEYFILFPPLVMR